MKNKNKNKNKIKLPIDVTLEKLQQHFRHRSIQSTLQYIRPITRENQKSLELDYQKETSGKSRSRKKHPST